MNGLQHCVEEFRKAPGCLLFSVVVCCPQNVGKQQRYLQGLGSFANQGEKRKEIKLVDDSLMM